MKDPFVGRTFARILEVCDYLCTFRSRWHDCDDTEHVHRYRRTDQPVVLFPVHPLGPTPRVQGESNSSVERCTALSCNQCARHYFFPCDYLCAYVDRAGTFAKIPNMDKATEELISVRSTNIKNDQCKRGVAREGGVGGARGGPVVRGVARL